MTNQTETEYYKRKYDFWEKSTAREVELKMLMYNRRIREFVSFLQKNRKHVLKSGAVLDVGCGLGEVIELLKKYGFKLEGVEPNDFARKKVSERGIKTYKDLRDVKKKFDLIVLFEVLEHIGDTHEFLQGIKAVLKPNGIFFLAVPNVNSLTFRLLGKKHISFHKNHLHYYNKRSIDFELAANGFRILKLYTERFHIFEFYKFFKRKKVSYKEEKYQNLKKSSASSFYYRWVSPALSSLARFFRVGETLIVYCEKERRWGS